MKLPLKKIRCDGGTQPRTTIYDHVVAEYAEAMREGVAFPPLTVFYDGKDHWLADGFHRLGAAMNLGLASIECEVRQGTLADAQWYSFSVNQAHGLMRTKQDKERAIKAALRHCKGRRPDNEIAKHIGVSHHTVAGYRQGLIADGSIPAQAHLGKLPRCAGEGDAAVSDDGEPGQPARIVTRKGKTYQMKVGHIGRAKKPNRKPGGIAKDAYQPTRSVAQPSEMLSISLPIANPHMAAKGMLSRYERPFLVALVKELTNLLKEGAN
jgi:hypothetical protein